MIVLQDVRKQYQNFEFHMSFEIPEGRITGLVGKNGAGKSTAIKLVLGLVKADSGQVLVLGKEASALDPVTKRRLGVSLAESGFSMQLTIQDIRKILDRLYPDFDRDYFETKCVSLQLPEKKRLREFSTGMKAKLKVLVALTHRAELLILDEPTAGLDVEARNEVLDLLREYVTLDEKRSILISSHISSDLESLCDDIYLIHDGRLVLHEDTDIILGQYGILKVDEETFGVLDQDFILKSYRQSYGYACFVSDKSFYRENYPGIVVENGGIDDLILMMTGGYRS